MKVLVKQFQSIVSASLEFSGLTVITGRSNLGKTALVRALSAALFGLAGDHFIREVNGQSAGSSGVGLLFADGHTIKWVKDTKTATIEIDGTKYSKFGRDQVTLTEPLGFMELRIGEGTSNVLKLRPQLAAQHESIFLLTHSDGVAAEVFRQLSRADMVSRAQDFARKDSRTTKATEQVRLADRQVTLAATQRYAMVLELEQQLATLREQELRSQQAVAARQRQTKLISYHGQLQAITLPRIPMISMNLIARKQMLVKLGRALTLAKISIPVQPADRLSLVAHARQKLTKLRALRAVAPVALPAPVVLPVELPERFKQWRVLLAKFAQLVAMDVELQAYAGELSVITAQVRECGERRQALEQLMKVCPTCQRAF